MGLNIMLTSFTFNLARAVLTGKIKAVTSMLCFLRFRSFPVQLNTAAKFYTVECSAGRWQFCLF